MVQIPRPDTTEAISVTRSFLKFDTSILTVSQQGTLRDENQAVTHAQSPPANEEAKDSMEEDLDGVPLDTPEVVLPIEQGEGQRAASEDIPSAEIRQAESVKTPLEEVGKEPLPGGSQVEPAGTAKPAESELEFRFYDPRLVSESRASGDKGALVPPTRTAQKVEPAGSELEFRFYDPRPIMESQALGDNEVGRDAMEEDLERKDQATEPAGSELEFRFYDPRPVSEPQTAVQSEVERDVMEEDSNDVLVNPPVTVQACGPIEDNRAASEDIPLAQICQIEVTKTPLAMEKVEGKGDALQRRRKSRMAKPAVTEFEFRYYNFRPRTTRRK